MIFNNDLYIAFIFKEKNSKKLNSGINFNEACLKILFCCVSRAEVRDRLRAEVAYFHISIGAPIRG